MQNDKCQQLKVLIFYTDIFNPVKSMFSKMNLSSSLRFMCCCYVKRTIMPYAIRIQGNMTMNIRSRSKKKSDVNWDFEMLFRPCLLSLSATSKTVCSNNLCGRIFSSLVRWKRSESQPACCHVCVWVSRPAGGSVIKGVKELILAGGHLREVLEAFITMVTMTWTDSCPWQTIISTHLKKGLKRN